MLAISAVSQTASDLIANRQVTMMLEGLINTWTKATDTCKEEKKKEIQQTTIDLMYCIFTLSISKSSSSTTLIIGSIWTIVANGVASDVACAPVPRNVHCYVHCPEGTRSLSDSSPTKIIMNEMASMSEAYEKALS